MIARIGISGCFFSCARGCLDIAPGLRAEVLWILVMSGFLAGITALSNLEMDVLIRSLVDTTVEPHLLSCSQSLPRWERVWQR